MPRTDVTSLRRDVTSLRADVTSLRTDVTWLSSERPGIAQLLSDDNRKNIQLGSKLLSVCRTSTIDSAQNLGNVARTTLLSLALIQAFRLYRTRMRMALHDNPTELNVALGRLPQRQDRRRGSGQVVAAGATA